MNNLSVRFLQIITLRAAAEKVQLQEDATLLLGEIGEKTSLRYVIDSLPLKFL